MKKQEKYDPEDLESLMLHKSFSELYPEEKEFVLKHLEGPDEYESMRKTLFAVQKEMRDGTSIKPNPAVKAQLLEHFVQEEKGGWKVWLNGLFVLPERRTWAIPVGIAAISILVWVVAIDHKSPVGQLAENKVKEEKIDKQTEPEEKEMPRSTESTPIPEAMDDAVEEMEVAEDDIIEEMEAEVLEADAVEDLANVEEIIEPKPESDNIVADESRSRFAKEESAKTVAESLEPQFDLADQPTEVTTFSNQSSAPVQVMDSAVPTLSSGAVASASATADVAMFDLLYTSY